MLKALLKTMRPRQWTKNGVVFAALVFDRQLTHVDALARTFAAMLLFCLLSSCVYIINDLADIEADRKHPQKKNRPIASGKLPIPIAIGAAAGILILTLLSAYWLSPALAIISVTYFVVNVAYSNWLKHIPLIDVMIIAAGFVLRVAAGVAVIQVERFSPWLYVVMTLGALYIGFGKRRAELTLVSDGANLTRRVLDGYNLPLLDQLITVVSSATVISYSLYTFSAPNLPGNHAMMLTIPFVLYGVFRYLYLLQVKGEGGAPEDILMKDHPLQITILLWGVLSVLILYLF